MSISGSSASDGFRTYDMLQNQLLSYLFDWIESCCSGLRKDLYFYCLRSNNGWRLHIAVHNLIESKEDQMEQNEGINIEFSQSINISVAGGVQQSAAGSTMKVFTTERACSG